MTKILAADIGGTNSRFAVFEGREGSLEMETSVWFSTTDAADFGHLLILLEDSDFPLRPCDADYVALAVAGPVLGGNSCNPPNIAWEVDLSEAREKYGFSRYILINDFAAQAFAVRTAVMGKALDILPGQPDEQSVVGVIGAGTGLGKAALVPDGRGRWLALSTEGGHSLFPFSGRREFDFQRFMMERCDRQQIIGDLVLSGGGLSSIHAFHTGDELAPAEVVAAFDRHPEVLEWAARFYGRACRHLALDLMATGGIVVSGGVAAKATELVEHDSFGAEFRNSETHRDLLAGIPVRLNRCEDSGLWGAAFSAWQQCVA
ncbi:glucokinase [Desulfovibrio ferrophilus]|uniref:Glucokinase n=1 Tax=Desulfovibrio ferrophilus TaxID=241368 RepID=A0A2Z6AUW8_9BACT|nr:glucokinase [Desulfovibrio ferrophilus]BBD07010.1 glucokinase [Desulfovibrio ferrophilus]